MKRYTRWGTTQTVADERMWLELDESISEAEFYLIVGRVVRFCVRDGLPLGAIAYALHESAPECALFMEYAGSAESFKFWAMVEEWSWETIKQTLLGGESNIDCGKRR